MQRQALPLILLTRAAPASARFAARIAGAGLPAEVLISPLQQVTPIDWHPPGAAPDALVLTSQNGVEAARRAGLSGLAFCVGAQTAVAARAAGFQAVSAAGDVRALTALIAATPTGRLWHLRGQEAAGDLAGALRPAGFEVHEIICYRMSPTPLSDAARAALGASGHILLPLFSPQSALRAAEAMAGAAAPVTILALSPAVARAAAAIPARRCLTARRPDADGMLEIVAEALNSGAKS